METAQLAAVAFLALVVAALAATLAYLVVRSRLTVVQCVLWLTALALCKCLWRTRWVGTLRLPSGQGALVVCNHRSSVDPFFIQTATLRQIHWLVAREYVEHPALRWFLRTCGVIAVGRGGVDTAATKAVLRIVKGGGVVGMLPEGRINMTEKLLLPARPGVALVALKTGVPVIPCYIDGAPYRRTSWSPFLMPARVEARFGEPVDLAPFAGREGEPAVVADAMKEILRAIARLAGQEDFEPQLAGRQWKPTEEELAEAMDAADRRRTQQR